MSSIALAAAVRQLGAASLQTVMVDFNSGYRMGMHKQMYGFASDELLPVALILLLVPMAIGAYYLIKKRNHVLLRLRHFARARAGGSTGRKLEALRQGRHELEAFTCHKGRCRFMGMVRLDKITDKSIHFVVMSAASTSVGYKNTLATFYFTPSKGKSPLNCLRGTIRTLNSKEIVLSRRCSFDYESRRQHMRADIRDPRFVKTRLWHTMPPSSSLEKLETMPEALHVDWHSSPGPRSPRVKDVSVTGMGIMVPLAKRDLGLTSREPVTMQLKVYNRRTRKFRPMWVAGVVRNRINAPGGRMTLGIQFTHRGVPNGSPTSVYWNRIDPNHGVPGLAGVLESLGDDAA